MMRMLVSLMMIVLSGLPVAAPAAQRVQSQTISGRTIASLADGMIRTLKVDKDRSVLPAFSVPDQTMPAGRIAMQAGTPLVNPSYINVPVTLTIDGKFSRSVYVGYRMQQYMNQAVAARDIAPGTIVSEEDVKMARVAFVGRQPNSTDVLIGRRVIAAFVKGQSIFIDSTSVDQIVKAGSSVIMTVRDGGVALTADVIARTSGGLGDQVIVYNPLTNKQLSGTVTGPGRVELELPGGDSQ
ncbi:MAG: flagellar basal body P-ring formation protein FlgA [Candidatus Eremiobacteraeota bacterium]|nr:flagellar basal body P-ring formation protein FlgA [Candidatus Eremiobacteraeota bacterium]